MKVQLPVFIKIAPCKLKQRIHNDNNNEFSTVITQKHFHMVIFSTDNKATNNIYLDIK